MAPFSAAVIVRAVVCSAFLPDPLGGACCKEISLPSVLHASDYHADFPAMRHGLLYCTVFLDDLISGDIVV
jgi:hypothetical protein